MAPPAVRRSPLPPPAPTGSACHAGRSLAYVATRGRRSFTSVSGFTSDSYQVVVDAELADEAARLLRREPHAEADHEPGGTARPR